jgi:DNA-binding CsgD family transcriptional regulator
LHATGVQSEADLAFSGLHQLLLPILDRREALPAGERDALGAAFGLLDVPVQDPFLIAQATLGLLADAAELTPLLLVCEDAQWLDRATASALLFVARRVGSEPIALLFAIRDGYPGPLDTAELPELRPARLDDQAARQLLDERRARLSPRCRQRVLRIADGNPLALIELPGEPASVGMGGWDPIADPVSLTVRLERAFMCRQAGLPEGTRAVLLVAAADGEVVRSELLAAASLIVCDQLDASALAPALAAGLVKADGARLAFRHPLIRSAIYQAAGNGERRAAHAALAAVLCDDPDRRTWHRAASSIGPDDHVASELEGLASRLARRGAISVAIAALERAAGLSSRPEHRAERLLAGAELGFEMGQASVVERLVGAAEQTGPNPRQRAQITWLREIFTDGIPGDPAPVLSLAAAGERCSSAGDTDLALKLLLGAGLRSWWRDPGEAVRARVVDVADAVPAAPHDPRLIAIIAVSAPMTRGSVTVERLSELDRRGLEDPQAAYLAGMAAHAVGHYELAARFFETSQSGLRAQGRLAVLCQVLTMAAWDQILLGDWVAAAASAEEGGRLARETGQPIWSAGAGIALALLAGVRGDGDRAEQLVTEAESVTIPRGLSAMRCVGALARGVTALGEGRHADALDHLSRMFDPADPAYHHADRFMGIGYLTDAAARCGQLDVARITLRELELLKEVTSSPALELGLVYARPILADDHEAEPLYRIGLSELHRWPFIRARLQLAYGAWLRRQRRVAASREPLRAAHETFGALGAVAWSERARQELVASGEEASPRRRDVEELTPQELQIAQMAATGRSNREIAQQLYLSPRTVATHLYRVFPKLAIRSRSELGGALGAGHK